MRITPASAAASTTTGHGEVFRPSMGSCQLVPLVCRVLGVTGAISTTTGHGELLQLFDSLMKSLVSWFHWFCWFAECWESQQLVLPRTDMASCFDSFDSLMKSCQLVPLDCWVLDVVVAVSTTTRHGELFGLFGSLVSWFRWFAGCHPPASATNMHRMKQ